MINLVQEVDRMSDLLSFLVSSEAIIIYLIAGIACFLCIVVYLVEKNHVRARQRHNTRELNKLVSQVREEANIVDTPVSYEEPVLEVVEEQSESAVTELLNEMSESVEDRVIEEVSVRDEVVSDPIVFEPIDIVSEVPVVVEERKDLDKEEFEYTTIEPDPETAQLELQKLTEKLKEQEEMEEEPEIIALTNYEEQQEENAIISLDELAKKSKVIYETNELTQYAEEGNAPISLQELEQKVGLNVSTSEPFIIENVVDEGELSTDNMEFNHEASAVVDDIREVPISISSVMEEERKFRMSPIISPIYGIEKQETSNDLELENTASYEKLDAEIKKTNEFLMTLKDLQKKLD